MQPATCSPFACQHWNCTATAGPNPELTCIKQLLQELHFLIISGALPLICAFSVYASLLHGCKHSSRARALSGRVLRALPHLNQYFEVQSCHATGPLQLQVCKNITTWASAHPCTIWQILTCMPFQRKGSTLPRTLTKQCGQAPLNTPQQER